MSIGKDKADDEQTIGSYELRPNCKLNYILSKQKGCLLHKIDLLKFIELFRLKLNDYYIPLRYWPHFYFFQSKTFQIKVLI